MPLAPNVARTPPAGASSARRVAACLFALGVVPMVLGVGSRAAVAEEAPATSPTTPTLPTPTLPTPSPTTPALGPATGGAATPEPSATTPTIASAPPTEPAGTDAGTSSGTTPAVVGPPVPTTVAIGPPVRRRTPRRGPADLVTVDPRATGPAHIEIDISAQRLLLYRGRTLYRSLHISTGSGRRYCVEGECHIARTPRGRFRVYNRISGWRTSRLGKLYNPLYFTGGYAIHGSGSVPTHPASHGCVRISMSNARWLPTAVPNGTPVWVHD